eukprot:m.47564 g.47564  ORF g.47564 m.47564 type:complete len:61 (+) comp47586_c1_seq1:397-579(+)
MACLPVSLIANSFGWNSFREFFFLSSGRLAHQKRPDGDIFEVEVRAATLDTEFWENPSGN